MRHANKEELLLALKHLAEIRGELLLPAQGSSMIPLIREGDICRFIPLPLGQEPQPGDILLFGTEEGSLVAHRLMHILEASDGDRRYRCRGDANVGFDALLRRDQLIGIVSEIRRPQGPSSRIIRSTGIGFRLWACAMLKLPLISRLLNRYTAYRRQYAGGESR